MSLARGDKIMEREENKIIDKFFKFIIDTIIILMGILVFCFITYSSIKYFYFSKHGVKNVVEVSYKRGFVYLTYDVDGEQYVFDITDELEPETKSKKEEIYYLPQQPDKYYRVLYWKVAGYGWLFLCALIPFRFICLKIVQLEPHPYEYVLFAKEFDLFPRNKGKNDGKIKDTDDLGEE